MSAYDLFQLEKFGDILPDVNHVSDADMYESGIEELNRIAAFIDAETEHQLFEQSL
jgi:hypothetical protein